MNKKTWTILALIAIAAAAYLLARRYNIAGLGLSRGEAPDYSGLRHHHHDRPPTVILTPQPFAGATTANPEPEPEPEPEPAPTGPLSINDFIL